MILVLGGTSDSLEICDRINKYEDMLKFLNQKYEIENFGWKNIFRE